MTDLAELEIRIKSMEVEAAAYRLDRLKSSGAGADMIANQMGGTFLRLAGIITSVTGGLGLMGMAIKGIGGAARWERLEASFSVLLGNMESAKKLLKEIDDFATDAGFGEESVAATARRMLTLGFEANRVVPTLKILADATHALGGGEETLAQLARAFSIMQNRAKLSTREVMMMSSVGIPAVKLLANALGKTVPETFQLITKGAISSKVAVEALLVGIQKRYGGTTEAMGQTTIGTFEKIKNKVNNIFKDIGRAILEAFEVRGRLDGIMRFVDRFGPLIVDLVRHLLGLPILFEKNRATVAKLAEEIKKVTQVAGWIALTQVINNLSSSILNVARSARALTIAMMENPWTIIPTLVAAAVAALVTYREETITILGTTAQIGDFVVATWEHIKDKTIFAWDVMTEVVTFAWEKITELGRAALEYLANLFSTFTKVSGVTWSNHFKLISDVAYVGLNFLLSLWVGTFRAIREVWIIAGEEVRAFGRILEALGIDWQEVLRVIGEALKTLIMKAVEMFGILARLGVRVVQEMKEHLQSIGGVEVKPPKMSATDKALDDFMNRTALLGNAALRVGRAFQSAFNENHLAGMKEKVSDLFQTIDGLVAKVAPSFSLGKFMKFFSFPNEIEDILARAGKRAGDRFMKELITSASLGAVNVAKLVATGIVDNLKVPRVPKPFLGGDSGAGDDFDFMGSEAAQAAKQIKDMFDALQDEIKVAHLSNEERQLTIQLLQLERVARKALSEDDIAQGEDFITRKIQEQVAAYKKLIDTLLSLGKTKNLQDSIKSLEDELVALKMTDAERELSTQLRQLEIKDVSKLTKEQKGYVEVLYKLIRARIDLNRSVTATKGLQDANKDLEMEIELVGKSNAQRQTATLLRQLEIDKIKELTDEQKNLINKYIQLANQLDKSLRVQANADAFASAFIGALDRIGDRTMSVKDNLRALGQELLKLIYQITLLDPLKKSLTNFLTPFAASITPSAKGNIFRNTQLVPFAAGGLPELINHPTTFPMAGGRRGIAGERGPEVAIAPLARTSSGELGVKMVGGKGGMTIHQHITIQTPDVAGFRKSRKQITNDLRQMMNQQ